MIVYAREVISTDVKDEDSKMLDEPCPYYIGKHKVYNLGMAKISEMD